MGTCANGTGESGPHGPDPRINCESVRRVIYATKTRTIWSPSTTLAAMGIERWPHEDKRNYNRMKQTLAALADQGQIIRRARLHSHCTLREVAYGRATD